MIKKIMVAYDGSKESYSAFLLGIDMAKKFEAYIEVFSVVRALDPPESIETDDNLIRGSEYYEKLLQKLIQESKDKGITINTQIAMGHPAEEIIQHAEKDGFDLIVIGHQTKNIFGRWFLGSISDKVIHHAPCNVIVVKKSHCLT